MRIWSKRLGLLVLALAVVAGFFFATREQPVPVDMAVIASGPMEVTIDEEGVTRVRDVYAVSSPIDGYLDRTTLKEGEAVQANDTIIASINPLDPPFHDLRTRAELTAAVDAARSSVALAEVEEQRAQTAYELAKSNFERAAKLAESRTISVSQLEQIDSQMQLDKAQVDSARAAIALRRAELATAQARLRQPGDADANVADEVCCVHLTAPIDGVVLKVLARSEQAISAGEVIAEIGDPQNLEIVVDLLSSDAARVRPGAPVTITDWGGDRDLRGTVRTVEPAGFTKVSALGIEEQRVNVIIDPDAVPERLGHGYRVLARLGIWDNPQALQVPIGALFRTGGQWSVFVVADGRAVLRTVEVGQMNPFAAEAVGGLEQGETVILYPNDQLQDGRTVEPR